MRRFRCVTVLSVLIGAMTPVLPGLPAHAGPGVEAATTFTVTTLADVGDGVCNAVCTLREAVSAAAAVTGRDTIVFAKGLAGGTVVLGGTQITVGSNLRIDGTNRSITLSGNRTSRILLVKGGAEVDLIGLTLADGAAVGGGAVLNAGLLTVVASLFASNYSARDGSPADSDGGAIRSTGTLIVTNSTFLGNHAQSGDGGRLGGGGISSSGALTVVASRIFANDSTGNGGGISSGGTATIVDSLVSGNEGDLDGGGVANSGTMTIRSSTITDNYAADLGAGILNGSYIGTGELTLESSTVTGNVSRYYEGGGMWVGSGSRADVRNSTFSGNSAIEGGGIYDNGGVTTYTNSLVAGNTATAMAMSDCGGAPLISGGFSLVGVGTGCTTVATDRTVVPSSVPSKVLRPLDSNGGLTPTQMLRFTGANGALDIGGTCPVVDQRGFTAPVDGPDQGTAVACDAGAVEAQGAATVDVVLAPSRVPAQVAASGGSVTYTARVTNVSGTTRDFDVWSRIQRPDGTFTGTLFGPVTVSLAPNASAEFPVSHSPVGPTGLYEVQFFAGTYATVVGGSDAFAVSKAGRA